MQRLPLVQKPGLMGPVGRRVEGRAGGRPDATPCANPGRWTLGASLFPAGRGRPTACGFRPAGGRQGARGVALSRSQNPGGSRPGKLTRPFCSAGEQGPGVCLPRRGGAENTLAPCHALVSEFRRGFPARKVSSAGRGCPCSLTDFSAGPSRAVHRARRERALPRELGPRRCAAALSPGRQRLVRFGRAAGRKRQGL